MPGAASVKIPALFLLMAVLSRTIGVGTLAPVSAASKAVWIIVRVFIDYLTDDEGNVDVRYSAFCISTIWPLWNGPYYLFFEKPMCHPRVS